MADGQAMLKARFGMEMPGVEVPDVIAPLLDRRVVRRYTDQAVPDSLLDALLALSKTITGDGETLRLASHKISLKQDEEEASLKIEDAFRVAGLAAPSVQDVLGKAGVEANRARSILQLLLRDKKLIRINDELVFHSSALQALRQLLAQRKGKKFAVSEFKDWTGISRKYAIPLLEFLDRERVTRRDGDSRLVL